jgi:hypothetical protein
MSIKNLFTNAGTVVSNKSLSDVTSSLGLESYGVISSSYSRYNLLLPDLNFQDPAEFAKYGSAEKYYENSIKKIAQTYPYDGSKKQKLEWRNNCSYLDLYLFENEYPRHTGSITIGKNFGTSSVKNNGYYETPTRTEYIKVNPGLSTGSIYDEDKDRRTSFSFNSEKGFCVEFYMNPNTWSADLATATFQVVLNAGALSSETTSSVAFPDGGFQFLIAVNTTDLLVGMEDGNTVSYITYPNAFSYNKWNRYSVNFHSGGAVDIWKDGSKVKSDTFASNHWPYIPVHMKLSGTIGAFCGFPYGTWYSNGARIGWNKFSGSLDDFRFWREARTDKEIASNWFCSVDGGYDSDEQLTPKMGWYYKFNESTVGTASIDANILDYSGRRNHATWIGYQSGSRLDYSPMINEFRDPILHLSSSRVYSFLSEKILSGKDYDIQNNGAIINNLPSFLKDEDSDNHYANFTQIIASMFDSFWLEIKSLTSLKDSSYFSSGSLHSDILLKLINSSGIELNSIFDGYSLKELIEGKNDLFSFETEIEKIKQVVYKNIYNNLSYIFKSKGTEKSIKSVFRSFGVDDDVIKIKSYVKEGKLEIDGSKTIDTVRRKNVLDLFGKTDEQNMNGTVFLKYCPDISGSANYLTNSIDSETNKKYIKDKTFEANILFPYKYPFSDQNHVFLNQNDLSASLFGFVQIGDSISLTSEDSTWHADPYKLNVFAVQRDRYSKDAKFVFILTGSNYNKIYTETQWYENVYDNTKWTFGLKFYDSNQYAHSGLFAHTTSFDILAFQEESGIILNSFSSSFDLYYTGSSYVYNTFLKGKTKPYIGALRTNFTGTLLYPTQAKFYNLKVWNTKLSDENIKRHSYDMHNFGTFSSSWNAYNIEDVLRDSNNLPKEYFPKAETLVINWDFEKEYVPNQSGYFTVSSFRSGSVYQPSNIFYASNRYNYAGIGSNFNYSATVIEKAHAIEQKNKMPTDYHSSDTISLEDDEQFHFGRKVKPMQFFYTVENSIYSVISEDMLNMFATIDEFNNLIGMPHEKFRTDYKNLRILRNLFYSKVKNSKIDVEKYFSYYKWLDGAIEQIISKLFPFSSNSDANVRNVIESHVLERSKHLWSPEIIKTSPKKKPLEFSVKSFLNSSKLNKIV